jgi:TetR/AcrR family transcriptional regulator, repressor for uid operon
MTAGFISEPPSARDTEPDRAARILDAAERCFVRSGFHRATMQEVAAEAGMSPGNLYRYFRSKEALATGLAERDRARVVGDMTGLDGARDFLAALSELARKHFIDEPREKAVLCLETWAEATRNPVFGTLTDRFDEAVQERMTTMFRAAQERGVIAASVDPKALAIIVSTLANGLFVRRAVISSFDAEREVGTVMKVIEAACAGRIDIPSSSHSEEAEAAIERSSSERGQHLAETQS